MACCGTRRSYSTAADTRVSDLLICGFGIRSPDAGLVRLEADPSSFETDPLSGASRVVKRCEHVACPQWTHLSINLSINLRQTVPLESCTREPGS